MAVDGRTEISLADDQIEIINNTTDAPLIFIDGAQGLMSIRGVVKINLYQIVQEFDKTPNKPGNFKKLIVARLSMTVQTAQSLSTWLAKQVIEQPDASSQAASSQSPDGE